VRTEPLQIRDVNSSNPAVTRRVNSTDRVRKLRGKRNRQIAALGVHAAQRTEESMANAAKRQRRHREKVKAAKRPRHDNVTSGVRARPSEEMLEHKYDDCDDAIRELPVPGAVSGGASAPSSEASCVASSSSSSSSATKTNPPAGRNALDPLRDSADQAKVKDTVSRLQALINFDDRVRWIGCTECQERHLGLETGAAAANFKCPRCKSLKKGTINPWSKANHMDPGMHVPKVLAELTEV